MKKILLILLIILPLVNTAFAAEDGGGKLLSRVKYVFPLMLPGEIIEVKKILSTDGEIKIISSSSEYDTMGKIRTLIAEEEQLARQRYGNIRGSIRGVYEFMSDQDSVEVEIILSVPLTNEILQRFKLDTSSVRGDDYIGSTSFICMVKKANLAIIAFDGDIIDIVKYVPTVPLFGGDEYLDTFPASTPERYSRSAYLLPDSVDIMKSWARGNGVICATNENGIHLDYLDSLRDQFNNSTSGHIDNATTVKTHTNMTFGCMARVAYEGTWTHVTGYVTDAICSGQRIETISRSYSESENPEINKMMMIDTIVNGNNNNNPVFCNPASNFGLGYVVNWGCYNGISVGGSEYFNEEYFGIATKSTQYQFTFHDTYSGGEKTAYKGTGYTPTQTRNPNPRSSLYAGVYFAGAVGDREMPNVVSPSTVSYGGIRDGILYSKFGLTQPVGATSGAAPTVNGLSACIISSNPTHMTNHPENVKTALMVTAVNIDGGLWNPLEDGRDGCGEVAGYDACEYVHNQCTYCSYGDTAVYGMSYGWLDVFNAQINTPDTVLRYYLRIPDPLPESRHLRVMVNWTSSVGKHSSGYLLGNIISDFDLVLRNCNTAEIAGACVSFDDNIEVIDIYPAYKLTPGDIYCVEVQVKYFALPPIPVSDSIRYSVGWAWPLDYAGKKITGTFSGDHEFCLLNRNLQIGPSQINSGSSMKMSATDRIELLPGTKIFEGADFTARITRNEAQYDPLVTGNSYDASGNLRDAWVYGDGFECDIFSRDLGVYFHGIANSYTVINNPKIKGNPSPQTGLTAAFWMRWFPGNGGPILCATKTGNSNEGYSIEINNSGLLSFSVGNSSTTSSVEYDINSDAYYLGKYPSNKGWTHITAVWSAGEYMKIYVNGEEKAHNQSSIVKTHSFPNDAIFLGKDWVHNYFEGSLIQFILYSGALSSTTIKGLPNESGWPTYQGEGSHRSNVTVDIEGNGNIDLAVDFNYIYGYNNTISQDTITSFPRVSTVNFTFKPDGVGIIDSVVIDNVNQGPIQNANYHVLNTGDGKIEVYFNP